MINTYCENLKETFAQMVYYGILKEEDAQCFRVEARIENASYVLAAASVALALLNTFVMRAANQYFRDLDLTKKEFKAMSDRNGEEIEDATQAIRRITPVPVLFTDAFRWFMVREDADPSRRIFLAKDGQDRGIDGITKDLPEEGTDLMADTLEVQPLDVSPMQWSDNHEYDEYDESEFYEETDKSHAREYISAVPRPRQPEVLPPEETISSHEAERDTASAGADASVEYAGGPGPQTVLSAVSELTEPNEPWRDV